VIGPDTTRLTIVLPHSVDARLRELAQREGRSLSNLAALLLREALESLGRDGQP
jgi:predicted DNA-binding protein